MQRFVSLIVVLLFFLASPVFATVVVFNIAGPSTWQAPAGVTVVQVECWGGGGAGSRSTTNNTGRGGGGGGGYAIRTAMAVTPLTTYNYTVGAGGVDGTSPSGGGDSTFTGDASVQCIGKAGVSVAVNTSTGTAGGTGSTGDTTHDGGAGADGVTTLSGGGGESGCTTAVGNNAISNAGGTGCDGGNGGAGVASCSSGGGTAGSPGVVLGGGGGGGCRGSASKDGGAGAVGQITLTFTAVTFKAFKKRVNEQ